MVKLFTEEDIRKKVSMKQAITVMREAFVQISNGTAYIPVRTSIASSDNSGQTLFMPSYSPSYHLFGLKMVSVFNNNAAKGLPVIQGNMLIMDGENGSPIALIEAEYLTSLRTGAASGLATDLLARKDAKMLAIFGTGTQAETQLDGILNVREIKKVIVFGQTQEKTLCFINRMSEKFQVDILQAGTPEELMQADIICTATTSTFPVFQSKNIKAGTHINGIGSYRSTMQELPSEVIANSLLIVDQYKAALSEAGDVVIPIQQGLIDKNHIYAELGEIIAGHKTGRTSSTQITVFKSVGNAIQDLAIAHMLLN
ncbi:MAG: ornithine cyclodeaminase [Bacteroidota bacterium]